MSVNMKLVTRGGYFYMNLVMVALAVIVATALLFPWRYEVQYRSYIGGWQRDYRRPTRKFAEKKCDSESKLYPALPHRIWDRRTKKVVYEYGKYRRGAVAGNRGSSTDYPCFACGTATARPGRATCGACGAGSRARPRIKRVWALMNYPFELENLFGHSLSVWKLEGIKCCRNVKVSLHDNLPGDVIRLDNDTMNYRIVGTVSCRHNNMKCDLTICPEHQRLSVGAVAPSCCAKLFVEKVSGAIRGWRLFEVEVNGGSYDLCSLIANYKYQPGVNVCPDYKFGLQAFHEVAGGFYSFRSVDIIAQQEPTSVREWSACKKKRGDDGRILFHDILEPERSHYWAIGSVLCFGGVKEAEFGYRSEKAIPEYLVMPPDVDLDYGSATIHLAERYNMKMISEEEAKKMKSGLVPFALPDDREES